MITGRSCKVSRSGAAGCVWGDLLHAAAEYGCWCGGAERVAEPRESAAALNARPSMDMVELAMSRTHLGRAAGPDMMAFAWSFSEKHTCWVPRLRVNSPVCPAARFWLAGNRSPAYSLFSLADGSHRATLGVGLVAVSRVNSLGCTACFLY